MSEQQSSISKFFKPAPTSSPSKSATKTSNKRPSSTIDLSLEDDDDSSPAITSTSSAAHATRPTKKPRLAESDPVGLVNPQSQSGGTGPSTPRNNSRTESDASTSAYALGSTVQTSSEPLTPEALEARESRRAAFKARLGSRLDRHAQQQEQEHDEGASPSDEETPEVMDEDDSPAPSKSKKAQTAAASTNPKGKAKAKAKAEVGPSGQTYTPLEKQILELKRKYPDVLLLVEVGYKYKFFGRDAQVAAEILGIVCFQNRNFLTASIPTHRRTVHVKRLLSHGHKVGIIAQSETAALKKVSANRSGPFTRVLEELYTPATYVDELNSVDDLDSADGAGERGAHALVCIVEQLAGGLGPDERVRIGLVSIVPSTGDVVYDEFADGHMRSELETRLAHIRPRELLIPSIATESEDSHSGLSALTRGMLRHFTGGGGGTSDRPGEGARIRVEEFDDQMEYSEAFDSLTEFFNDRQEDPPPGTSSDDSAARAIASILSLPKLSIIALAHIITHLKPFGLTDVFARAHSSAFARFSERTHMLLGGNTLSNLEIYQNQTDGTSTGSLVSLLDRTKTKFGARLMRGWIGKPLVDQSALQERIDAVEELLGGNSHTLDKLRALLKGMPDLVKGLARVQYGKSSPQELSVILEAFEKIGSAFQAYASPDDVDAKSRLLREIAFALPAVKEPIEASLAVINVRKASQGEKAEMWRDEGTYPAIGRTKRALETTEKALADELKNIRKVLHRPSLPYVSVSQDEYLVEVPKSSTADVPSTFIRVSGTKKVIRWHSPEVKKLLAEKGQLQETLVAESDAAYRSFLKQVASHYAVLRAATNKLAMFDCLQSLSTVANEIGYVKPEFVDGEGFDIVGGRHPMVETLRSDPFVPNDIFLGGKGRPRHKIITGPNMGGKSSFVRMTALIIIMAQIGSYVPAKSVKLGMHDAVLTRMGAHDELARGRSTFMVEMSETSEILKTATPKSLVILDELGRGTSTFDGMAIAHAVMRHLVETIKCETLFITHYPLVASEMARKYPDVSNGHMSFIEEFQRDGTRAIQFLYKLAPDMARRSYGIECAMLAGLPNFLLDKARTKSQVMEETITQRHAVNAQRRSLRIVRVLTKNSEGWDEGTDEERIQELEDIFASTGDERGMMLAP